MNPGTIVLFRFPQTDLSESKLRPALILARVPGKYNDFLICMITSRIKPILNKYDIILTSDSEAFVDSGLKADSIIRATRLAVASHKIFVGSIGKISPALLTLICKNISKWIYPRSRR